VCGGKPQALIEPLSTGHLLVAFISSLFSEL
jgi:hypothetical protein